MKLHFLGGAGTVTGSKYLLEARSRRILVDCGLFQGPWRLRERNWEPPPFFPAALDAVVLTHAHLDHSGYVPRLVRGGFSGPVICTQGTADLCGILLPDAGHLNEREAEYLNRKKLTRHKPALALYTEKEATRALARLSPAPFGKTIEAAPGISVTFRRAGHILGAAIVVVEVEGRRIVFSGDLGRYGSATLPDPEPVADADVLVVESTYGNRTHAAVNVEQALAEVINRTAGHGGTVVIPAFAVGRTQTLFFHLERMKRGGAIPKSLPVFLDSPMAIDASGIFCRNLADHKLSAAQCKALCEVATYTRSVGGSKSLDADPVPKIIVSASGMATGGRVIHHLKSYLPDRRNTVVLIGFQARGTRGAALRDGAKRVTIFGNKVAAAAEIISFDALSAHADAGEILTWLSHYGRAPARTFIVHGEADAAQALNERIGRELGWRCAIPRHGQSAAIP